MNVSTNNFDAESGICRGCRHHGPITKSGTNEIHGSAFWHHENNSALSARDYFQVYGDLKSGKEKYCRSYNLGGPIIKDKLFFFGGYEATIERTAQVLGREVFPTAAEKTW